MQTVEPFFFNQFNNSKLGGSTVQSSADIVIQNRRISQSELSTINIRDVVNIIALHSAACMG